MKASETISIVQLADRTGLSVSAIRFYETKRLVTAERNSGGQRRFRRSDIRRLSFVMAAQQLGFSINQIGQHLQGLPDQRTPTKTDWERLSRSFRAELEDRIATLERLRDLLDGCIGCGCLSLKKCRLYLPGARAARHGTGPRYLMRDRPDGPWRAPCHPTRTFLHRGMPSRGRENTAWKQLRSNDRQPPACQTIGKLG